MFVLDLNVVYCLHQEIPFHTQPQTCKCFSAYYYVK